MQKAKLCSARGGAFLNGSLMFYFLNCPLSKCNKHILQECNKEYPDPHFLSSGHVNN